MQDYAENVRQDLVKQVPASVVNEISCFVFYDNHPRDKRNIDIIICSRHGEIKEYYQREVVCSINLATKSTPPSEITIFRNTKCELFYLVNSGDELFILSRGENIQMLKKISNVDAYDINDTGCSGIYHLKVLQKDDAVPIIFDDNFESMGEQALFLKQFKSYDTIPLIKDLMRKHTEAKFAVKTNKKAYKDLLTLRQASAFNSYSKINPHNTDAPYNNITSQVDGALKVKTAKPWVKVCNKKVVIAVEVLNKEPKPLEDVHILLHHAIKSPIAYQSKLFVKTNSVPCWREIESRVLQQNTEAIIIAIVDITELRYSVTSKIEFNSVICYKYQTKEYLLSFDNISISATNVMGEGFDVLSNVQENENYSILALLATTEKIDICLRLLKKDMEVDMDVTHIFKNILKFENLGADTFVHRMSPYHVLYGTMVILLESDKASFHCCASLYTRSESQALALIHYIHDSVPCRVIITPANYKIIAKAEELSQYNEDVTPTSQNLHLIKYRKAVLNQSAMTLDYLDKCMIKMNENKDPNAQSKLGCEIDIFADGVECFKKYRTKVLEEAAVGADSANFSNTNDIVEIGD